MAIKQFLIVVTWRFPPWKTVSGAGGSQLTISWHFCLTSSGKAVPNPFAKTPP